MTGAVGPRECMRGKKGTKIITARGAAVRGAGSLPKIEAITSTFLK